MGAYMHPSGYMHGSARAGVFVSIFLVFPNAGRSVPPMVSVESCITKPAQWATTGD